MAAEHGLVDSQFNFAIMHENGLGMERDAKAAYKWYSLAARGGDGPGGGQADHPSAHDDDVDLFHGL